MALVPAGGNGSNFQQQGSLDWVALANTTHSTTIAVLARLAGAGVDNLTVAFGQAMCSKLPIGSHGEKILAEAMKGLTAKSFAEDWIWVGVGVRHVLRDLVRTSQGCSLVALCGALTEGYSIAVSALVMYEIAKQCGGPRDLIPSYEQWKALVEVAASVFTATTFGIRLSQIVRSGMRQNNCLFKIKDTQAESPHPTDLAKALLSVGQIVQGGLQSVTIQGSYCCSWIAVWADMILGLRVLVQDAQGVVVFANFEVEKTFSQVCIQLVVENDGSVACVQKSHVVRSGGDFIRKCFSKDNFDQHVKYDCSFGRNRWETVFSDLFGADFEMLMPRKEDKVPILPLFEEAQNSGNSSPIIANFKRTDHIFARFLAFSILFMLPGVPDGENRHQSASRCLDHAIEQLPELRQCSEQTLFEIIYLLEVFGNQACAIHEARYTRNTREGRYSLDMNEERYSQNALNDVWRTYIDCVYSLERLCNCPRHREHVTSKEHRPKYSNHFCLKRIAITIRQMVLVLARVTFDTVIQPTTSGLRLLYSTATTNNVRRHGYECEQYDMKHLDSPLLFSDLKWEESRSGPDNLEWYLALKLFSVDEPPIGIRDRVAHSDGKIYSYIHVLEELTDDIATARKLHIGSGHIQYLSQFPHDLYDGESNASIGYGAEKFEVVDSIDGLKADTTSSPIQVRLKVDEMPTRLSVNHQVTTYSGDMFISPISFLEQLQKATDYLHPKRHREIDAHVWSKVLQGRRFELVHGEGRVDQRQKLPMLRPHRGNTLGRCVAISKTKGEMALVKTDEELEIFARTWAVKKSQHERKQISRVEEELFIDYFVLIS